MASWDPHFTPRVTERDWDDDGVIPVEVKSVEPLHSLNGAAFATRHRLGTQKEFLMEKELTEAFNKRKHSFKAWPIFFIREMENSAVLLVFVEPSDHDSMIPNQGEKCDLVIPGFHKTPATRVDNPCSLWRVRHDLWEKCSAFHVHLKGPRKIIRRSFPRLTLAKGRMNIPPPSKLRSLQVIFELRVSTSTRNAELGALYTLEQGRMGQWEGHSRWQIDAYKHFLYLGSPTGNLNLLAKFPHMLDPFTRPDSVSPRLVELVQALNNQQKHAFHELLCKIPNGICVVNGSPGAGKTRWNLVVAALLQSKDEIQHAGSQSPEPWKNKVLYLIDINRPLDDAANKMTRLYNELGLTKKSEIDGSTVPRNALRMLCWSYEKLTATRKRLEAQWEELDHRMQQPDPTERSKQGSGGPLQRYNPQADDSEEVQVHRFAPAFRSAETAFRARPDEQSGYIAPSLDEAACALYDRFKDTRYSRLQTIRRRMERSRSTDLEELENVELEKLYRDTLMEADIVFTTPVCASKFSSSMFSPTLVIFDEAAHARELSTLIALAHFNPAVWIFSGDVKQTKPFVRSFGDRPCRNEHAPQLRVSMMERALLKYPNRPSLNINHRAHGNLQQLASTLFYDNKMIPANDPAQPNGMPPSTAHLRSKYIMPMKRGEGNEVSRLLVSLRDPGAAKQPHGKSWWHQGHRDWVMDLALKLLKDQNFKQTNGTDQATILIMTPYKEASNQYRKAIRELKVRHPALKDRVIEARTIDSAQGHEADVVMVDFVREHPTPHLEDRNRLCVALTRARQAELLLMHPALISTVESRKGCLGSMVSICKRAGEYVSDPAQPITEVRRETVVVAHPTVAEDAGDQVPEISNRYGGSGLLGVFSRLWPWSHGV